MENLVITVIMEHEYHKCREVYPDLETRQEYLTFVLLAGIEKVKEIREVDTVLKQIIKQTKQRMN